MRIGFGPVSKGCRNTPHKFCDWARPVRRPDNGGSGEIRRFGGGPIGFPVSVGHPKTAVESSAADRAGGGGVFGSTAVGATDFGAVPEAYAGIGSRNTRIFG